MRLRPIICGVLIAAAGAVAPASIAQEKPPLAAAQTNAEAKRLAQALIEEALQTAHAAEIYADLRHTLRDVYIPILRDLVQGSYPGVPAPDPNTAAVMAKLLTLLDYVRKAGDELDIALDENHDAIASDIAEEIAKTAEVPEIKEIRDVLALPAVRKSFDAIYAATKLVTGFSYEDSLSFAEFSAWARDLNFDVSQAVPGTPGKPSSPPSKRKLAQAGAFVDDLVRLSHLDEMVGDVRRFMREVYAETAPMSDEDRQELRDQIDQYEFTYNMQKTMVVAMAPTFIATALTDEQLSTLHGFIRSRAFAKAFDLIRNVVKAGTAFTKDDVVAAQKSFDALTNKANSKDLSSEEKERSEAAWKALITKWTEILKNRISPETRSGLEKSFEELQGDDIPI
jgi:hypothetical protein